MPDSKITALTSIGASTDPANDPLVLVDVSDTSMAATGTMKKVTLNQLLGASGTATLASATITGDLTVDTSTLKVDSANNRVGIGTASPAYPLQVQAAAGNIQSFTDGTTPGTLYSGGGYVGLTFPAGTGGFFINPAGNFNTISTNGVERVRIDSGGNVGIGVTPSAWNSSYRGLQLGAGGAISAHTSASLPWLVATSNSFINSAGDWKFINNGYSTRYLARGDDGTQSWWTSNNGLAGGTVAYTQAMTLDASGRLLVGKTSGVNNIETVGAGVDGRGTVTGVSTVATTIYTIKQSATAAMCVVFGDDGSNGFCDIVLFLATVAPKVVSSQTLYGSPAARTYSASTTNLQLALASGTLSIRTAALSTLNT